MYARTRHRELDDEMGLTEPEADHRRAYALSTTS